MSKALQTKLQFPKEVWALAPTIFFFFFNFFAWGFAWKKVLTMDQLKRSGWALAYWCCFKSNDESTNCILLHHGVARSLWLLLFLCFIFFWMLLSQRERCYWGGMGVFGGKNGRKMLKVCICFGKLGKSESYDIQWFRALMGMSHPSMCIKQKEGKEKKKECFKIWEVLFLFRTFNSFRKGMRVLISYYIG